MSIPNINTQTVLHFFLSFKKFGSIRADLIEQMRFKQRLKVIQTLEDTTKRNVVGTEIMFFAKMKTNQFLKFKLASQWVMDFKSVTVSVLFQKVRTIVTETSFTIDELEELYALFKVKLSKDKMLCLQEMQMFIFYKGLCLF